MEPSQSSAKSHRRRWLALPVLLLLLTGLALAAGRSAVVEKESRMLIAAEALDEQLQSRFDLLPDLVSVVAGDLDRTGDRAVVDAVAAARTAYLAARTPNERLTAAADTEAALSALLDAVSQNQDLRKLRAVDDLARRVDGTDARLDRARRDYEKAARSYNTAIESFPHSLVAWLFGFDKGADAPGGPSRARPAE